MAQLFSLGIIRRCYSLNATKDNFTEKNKQICYLKKLQKKLYLFFFDYLLAPLAGELEICFSLSLSVSVGMCVLVCGV